MNDIPFTYQGLVTNMAISAFSAAVTFGIGEVTSGIANFWTRASVQAFAHGSFNGAMTGIQGGNFWAGFASGAISSIASTIMMGGSTYEYGVVDGKSQLINEVTHKGLLGSNQIIGTLAAGAISGGAGAALAKGNFWQGAVTGLMVAGLNHLAHKVAHKIAINNDTKKYLIEAGYDPDEDIKSLSVAKRAAYIKTMINKVTPSRILYNDIKGVYEIYYSSSLPDNAVTTDNGSLFTTYGPSAFSTNRNLFLTTIHEGLHLWDISHGLINNWGVFARGITETRAYQMKRWFNGGSLVGKDLELYNKYKSWTTASPFNNFMIKSYPIFFKNIQR